MQPACAASSSTPITSARANPSRRRSGSVATQRTQPDPGDSGRSCSDAVETNRVPASTTKIALTVGSHSSSRSTPAASHVSPSKAEPKTAANAPASPTRARRTSSGAPTCGMGGTPESVRRHIVTSAGTSSPVGSSLIGLANGSVLGAESSTRASERNQAREPRREARDRELTDDASRRFRTDDLRHLCWATRETDPLAT